MRRSVPITPESPYWQQAVEDAAWHLRQGNTVINNQALYEAAVKFNEEQS